MAYERVQKPASVSSETHKKVSRFAPAPINVQTQKDSKPLPVPMHRYTMAQREEFKQRMLSGMRGDVGRIQQLGGSGSPLGMGGEGETRETRQTWENPRCPRCPPCPKSCILSPIR